MDVAAFQTTVPCPRRTGLGGLRGGGIRSPTARRGRFAGEARAAGALNHPGIVAVYDVGDQDGAFYIVTESVDGSTLRSLMQKERISQRRAIDLAAQAADALAAAHAAGMYIAT